MSYSIRLHSIKCVEESNEVSSADEPYVLATTIDLTPPPPTPIPLPVPIPTPQPGRPVITRLYGPWEHFDEDDILDLVGERPMWGTFTEPWEPEDIGNPGFVCFVVSVMEHDHGSPERYRGLVQTAATASLAGSFQLQRPARVTQLLADVRSAIALTEAPTLDNHVGTLELLLDTTDLAIPIGTHKDKKLFFDGGSEGKWELVFRVVHHERRVFPAARLTALSRSPDMAEISAVGPDRQLHGNWFQGRWHGWYTLPGPQFDQLTYLASASRGSNHMEVWGIGADGMMRGIWFDNGWKGWYDLPGAEFRPGAPLAAVSRYRDFMEVWAVDVHGVLRGKYFVSGEGWKPEGTWYTLGGPRFPSGAHIAAVTRSPFDMQVFVVADDAPIHTVRWAPDAWGPWKQLGPEWFPPGTPIAAVVRKLPVPAASGPVRSESRSGADP